MIQLAIRRPASVVVGVLLVLLFGGLSLADIPIQLTPDIVVPTISINTRWPGAAPTEVEAEILEKQEEALKSLPGLERMTSTASSDSAGITLELRVGTAIEEALVRVTNRLSQVPNYPLTARQPVVSTANSTGPPLAVVLIQSSSGRSMDRYRTWAAEEIVPPLERIRGVASVRLIGGQDRQIEVSFDPAELAARKVTLSEVARVLRAELRDISAGDITIGKRRYLVRTPVAPQVPKDLEQVLLKTSADGRPIRLGDVAKVDYGYGKPTAIAMADGRSSLALLFFREAGTNVLEVTKEIRKTVEDLDRRRGRPEGININLVFDQTAYIEGALDLVRQNLLIGGALAILVLLAFLRSIGPAALVGLSIPICVMGTVLGMALLGRTVNIVSLAGMAFAVGMVVDNSIVVLENIYTWRSRDLDSAAAAHGGTREVGGAIIASTLTTAAVFVPIIAWRDEVGELLRDVAVAISVAVFVSLIASVLVIPSFAARLRARAKAQADARPSLLVRLGLRFRAAVSKQVRVLTATRVRALGVVIVALVAAGAAVFALLPPMEYLPTGSRNLVFGILVPPPGYSVEELARIGKGIQADMVRHTGVERDGYPAVARSFFVARPERAFMGAGAVDPNRTDGVMRLMRASQGKVPGVFRIATRASLFGRRIGGGRAIELDISGSDLGPIVGTGRQLMGALRGALPGAQARPVPSLDLGAPEIRVQPRREQLSALGMNAVDLGLAVDALVDGATLGELSRAGQPALDVVLRANKGGARTPEGLAAAAIATTAGKVVPLGTLAKLSEVLGPSVIQRIERRRAVTLVISPPADVALEDALGDIRKKVLTPMRAAGKLPENVRIDLAGSAGKLESTKSRMGRVLLLAIVISLLLMAAVFEDFIAPLAIIVTVPLATAGGLLGLLLVDKFLGRQPLDMMTAVGFLILVGVVVNNAILVVDGALTRVRQGMRVADAVASAVERRVRPIFMSTLTSLAGLLPLVLASGSGSELYRGVGSVVLGGLALATVLTLYVVPAAFVLLYGGRRSARS